MILEKFDEVGCALHMKETFVRCHKFPWKLRGSLDTLFTSAARCHKSSFDHWDQIHGWVTSQIMADMANCGSLKNGRSNAVQIVSSMLTSQRCSRDHFPNVGRFDRALSFSTGHMPSNSRALASASTIKRKVSIGDIVHSSKIASPPYGRDTTFPSCTCASTGYNS